MCFDLNEHIETLENISNKCKNNYIVKARLNKWYKIKEETMKQQELKNKINEIEKMIQDMSDKFDKRTDDAKHEIKDMFEEIKKELQ